MAFNLPINLHTKVVAIDTYNTSNGHRKLLKYIVRKSTILFEYNKSLHEMEFITRKERERQKKNEEKKNRYATKCI